MQLEFLSRILPTLPPPTAFGAQGTYYSVGLGYERPQQTPHSSIASLIERCNALSNAGQNAYMALGSFRDPMAGRKQVNAVAFKSVWADIDAGKQGGKYADAKEALLDLSRFVEKTGLNPTYIVSSGMGLHVYWCFTKNVDAAPWKQVAGLFQQLCNQESLAIDPARATDGASVLRLPGTIHTKTGRVVKIIYQDSALYQPAQFVETIANQLVDNRLPATTPQVNVPTVITGDGFADLMGMGPQAPTAKGERVAYGCPQIMTMGFLAYPSWFAAMSVLRRCEDGLEWAHKLSALDSSRYDHSITEKRFYEAHADMPATCATFERLDGRLCAECKHRGQIKSPIQCDRLTVAPSQEASVVPAQNGHLVFPSGGWEVKYTPINSRNFQITDSGIEHITVNKKKDGSFEEQRDLMCTSKLMFRNSEVMLKDKRPHRSFIFDAIHPSGEIETVRYIIDEDNGVQNTVNWFNNAKIYPVNPNVQGNLFMSFMNAYLNSVVHTAKEVRTFDRFGWVDDFIEPNTKKQVTGFVTGDGIITASGVYEAGYYGDATNKAATRLFHNSGTLEKWKYVPQMYTTLNQKLCQLAMCFGFAAPLMKYSIVEARNCLFNVWSSKGGVGKSCLLRMVASIWGNPMESFFGKDTTFAAMEHKLMLWNNLPAMMDELTEMSDEMMTNVAFAVCSGKQREKMQQGGKAMVDTGDWETCTFSTANKSFKECIARRHADTDAATKRVMDYEWDGQSYDDQPEIQQYILACTELAEHNYGLAGPEFLFQLMTQPEKLDGLRRYVSDWAVAHGFKGDERFMAHPLAVALQAGRWAVEFGLLDYNMDELEKWVLNVFVPHNRKQTAALAPDFKDMMVEYLNDRTSAHMLVVKDCKRGAKELDPGSVGMPDGYVIRMPSRELYARYERATRELTFLKSDFTNWCKDKKVSAMLILKELETKGIKVENCTARLSRNVSYIPAPRGRCMILRADALDALGYNDDEASDE